MWKPGTAKVHAFSAAGGRKVLPLSGQLEPHQHSLSLSSLNRSQSLGSVNNGSLQMCLRYAELGTCGQV